MNRKFVMGLAAGVGAALVATRLSRARLAISFEGRVVVLTGGSRGLGLVMARQLVDEGARVVLLARDLGELDRAREELEAHGRGEVLTIRCDVRRRADVRAAIDLVLDKFRSVDVLINNAGVIQVGPLEHMDHEDFENAMATHFWGPLHLILEIAPIMRHRRFGRIVNIASIGGKIAIPHMVPYTASKFALVGLSDGLRAELAPHGIRVTTVAPGLMRTGSPINAQMKGQHQAEYAWFAIADSIPGWTISAERAADKILSACAYGDPSLTITPHAKLAAVLNDMTPGLVAFAGAMTARLLPGPAGADGNEPKRGRESESKWAPSLATTLSDRAAVLNNEA